MRPMRQIQTVARIALLAVAATTVVSALAADPPVGFDLKIVDDPFDSRYKSALAVTRNRTRSTLFGHISYSLAGKKLCDADFIESSDLNLPDPRTSPVVFRLPPGQWFANWQFFVQPPDKAGCQLSGLVVLTDGETGPDTGQYRRISNLPRIPDEHPVIPVTPGRFRSETVVWREEMTLHGREPDGDSLQVQLLIVNLTGEPRRLAVTGRELSCTAGRPYDFIIGPGAGHPIMTTGPINVPPHGWGVLAQRLRGTGDPIGCSVTLVVSERLGDPNLHKAVRHIFGKHWREALRISVPLRPLGSLNYAGPIY